MGNLSPFPHFLPIAFRAIDEYLASGAPFSIDGEQLNRACAVAVGREAMQWHRYTGSSDAGGLDPVNVIETFVPTVAREIGRRWETDALSFSQVTVASARLQELVRKCSGAYVTGANTAHKTLTTKAIFIVPETENHSIGGIVAARKAQRLGLNVHLIVAKPDEEILALAEEEDVSCFGISVASRRQLQPADDLIKRIHDKLPNSCAILGGNVLNIVEDMRNTCEADAVTNDVKQAVEIFQNRDARLFGAAQVN